MAKIITNTNGNSVNGISGSRVTVKNENGVIIDQFCVPTMYCSAEQYCRQHPGGKYGKRFFKALEQ